MNEKTELNSLEEIKLALERHLFSDIMVASELRGTSNEQRPQPIRPCSSLTSHTGLTSRRSSFRWILPIGRLYGLRPG